MSRTHNAREKRERKIAEKALEFEKKQNEEKIAEIIPDSSLFKEDDNKPKEKKSKILLHPRPKINEKPPVPKVEYKDLWDTPKPSIPFKNLPKKQTLPKSSESYHSSDLNIKKKKNIEEIFTSEKIQIQTYDPAEQIETNFDDGMGDSLSGDQPIILENPITSVPPVATKKEKDLIKLNAHFPDYLPMDQRIKLRKEIKENNLKLRLQKEKELEEEIKNDLDKPIINEKPNNNNKNKIDPIERFLPDEPEYQLEEIPKTLSELPSDQKQFSRLQRDFEIRRKVGLHD